MKNVPGPLPSAPRPPVLEGCHLGRKGWLQGCRAGHAVPGAAEPADSGWGAIVHLSEGSVPAPTFCLPPSTSELLVHSLCPTVSNKWGKQLSQPSKRPKCCLSLRKSVPAGVDCCPGRLVAGAHPASSSPGSSFMGDSEPETDPGLCQACGFCGTT